MKLTTLFRLRKPDGTDPVNIEDFNDNFDVIDEELGKRLESTGAASDMTVAFEQASARTNLKTGEKISVSFGKIMKWFADLGTAAFQSVANNLTTTVAGSLLDARQGKILNDKYNQLNSEMLGKAPASDPTLTFKNAGGIGCKVELRKSGGTGSGPYVLSLVCTDSSGKMDYYALVDQDGNRSYAYLAELDEVKNTIDVLCNRLGITL